MSLPDSGCDFLSVAVLKGFAAIVTALLEAARGARVLEELWTRRGASRSRLLFYAIELFRIGGWQFSRRCCSRGQADRLNCIDKLLLLTDADLPHIDNLLIAILASPQEATCGHCQTP